MCDYLIMNTHVEVYSQFLSASKEQTIQTVFLQSTSETHAQPGDDYPLLIYHHYNVIRINSSAVVVHLLIMLTQSVIANQLKLERKRSLYVIDSNTSQF